MPDTESEKTQKETKSYFFNQILPNITVMLYVLKDKISSHRSSASFVGVV